MNYLKFVRGVQLFGFSISFSWSKDKVEFSDLLNALNDWGKDRGERVIVVLDEAQELIKLKGYNILPSIAYAFDNLRNLTFIVMGSEVRVKSKFLKLEDANSPLYGRAFLNVRVNPFDKDTAIKFLVEGFQRKRYKLYQCRESLP